MIKKIAVFTAFSLVTTFIVSNHSLDSDSEGTESRSPSSLKEKFDHSHASIAADSFLLRTEKLLAPISIHLSLNGFAPEKSGDEFTMTALVKTRYDLQALNVEWILPQGIELVSGSLTDSLNSLVAGETREVQAIFRQISDFNEQIHLRIKSHDANLPFGASAQFNTFNQNAIDESVLALEKRAREYMSNQKEKTKLVK